MRILSNFSWQAFLWSCLIHKVLLYVHVHEVCGELILAMLKSIGVITVILTSEFLRTRKLIEL